MNFQCTPGTKGSSDVALLIQPVKLLKVKNKEPKRRHWRRYGVFIVNFKHISHLVLVFLLLTRTRCEISLKLTIKAP